MQPKQTTGPSAPQGGTTQKNAVIAKKLTSAVLSFLILVLFITLLSPFVWFHSCKDPLFLFSRPPFPQTKHINMLSPQQTAAKKSHQGPTIG
jgi:hypothetical protein